MSSESSSTMHEWYRRLLDGSSNEMRAAMAAGIPLEFSSEPTPGGVRITATTKYPCALVGNTLFFRKTDSDVETT